MEELLHWCPAQSSAWWMRWSKQNPPEAAPPDPTQVPSYLRSNLLTTACVGAVCGSDSVFCTGCAGACWSVGSPGPAANLDKGYAGQGWPPGDAPAGCCRPPPSAERDFYPPGLPARSLPGHGRSSTLSGHMSHMRGWHQQIQSSALHLKLLGLPKYNLKTANGINLWCCVAWWWRYLLGKKAPPQAGKARVPFSFGEPGSECSWNRRRRQTAVEFPRPAPGSLPGNPGS